MADLHRRAAVRIAGTVSMMIALCAGGSAVAAPAISAPLAPAPLDVPLQPQCGPDPLTLINPCQGLPASEPTAGQAQQIPWDVIDRVLFG